MEVQEGRSPSSGTGLGWGPGPCTPHRQTDRQRVRGTEGEGGTAGTEGERDGGREAYPHLIQLTGAIWQLLAR